MVWLYLKQQALVAQLLDNHHKLAARIDDFGPAVLCGNAIILFLRGYEFSSAAILQGPLHEAFGNSALVNLAYFLGGAALSPMLRELVMLCDLKWLGVASCLCSLLGSSLAGTAQGIEVFLLGRVFMSIGSVSLHQMQSALIQCASTPTGSPALQGIIWTFFAIGFIVGPLVAGALSEHLAWNWAFFITMPLSVTTTFFFAIGYPHLNLVQESPGARCITKIASHMQEHSDLVGDSLWIIVTFLIYWACSESRSDKPVARTILGWLLFGFFSSLFAFQQFRRRRGQHYSISSIMFRQERCLALSFLGTALASLGYGTTIFRATVFSAGNGQSIMETAISLTVLLGPMVMAMILSGYLLVKLPYVSVFVCGSLLMVGGSCMQQSVESTGTLFLLSLAESAAGLGLTWQAALPISYVMIRSVDGSPPHDLRSGAVALFNIAQMGGICVAMAVMEPLLGFSQDVSIEAQGQVLRRSAYLTLTAGCLGFLTALCMRFKRLPQRRQTDGSQLSERNKEVESGDSE